MKKGFFFLIILAILFGIWAITISICLNKGYDESVAAILGLFVTFAFLIPVTFVVATIEERL